MLSAPWGEAPRRGGADREVRGLDRRRIRGALRHGRFVWKDLPEIGAEALLDVVAVGRGAFPAPFASRALRREAFDSGRLVVPAIDVRSGYPLRFVLGLEAVARSLPVRDRGAFAGLAFGAFEERIAFELGFDIGGKIEARKLQKLDRLQELRRHDQGLALAHFEPM